jgi:hypothetical protein
VNVATPRAPLVATVTTTVELAMGCAGSVTVGISNPVPFPAWVTAPKTKGLACGKW